MRQLFDGRIKQRTLIAVPPERVFDTITSAEGWDAFFTTGMKLEPQPGGICQFAWSNWGPDKYTGSVPGRVEEISRPTLFSFSWGSKRQSTVKFQLEAVPGGTVVTITEEGYEDTPDGRAMILECASGWGEAATLLKFYLEHGIRYRDPVG